MTTATKKPTVATAKPKSTTARKRAASATASIPTLAQAAATGQVKLFHRRQNKTLRHLPYLAPGSDSRKAAEAVAKRREAGETVGAIAEDLKASVATVRRMITGLALAHAIEAGEYDKQWKPEDQGARAQRDPRQGRLAGNAPKTKETGLA